MRRLNRFLMVMTAAMPAMATHAAAQGCAMCGSAVTPDDPLAGALNTSVLFLMAAPYTLVGGAAAWFYWRHRGRSFRRRGDVVLAPWATGAPMPSTDPKEE